MRLVSVGKGNSYAVYEGKQKLAAFQSDYPLYEHEVEALRVDHEALFKELDGEDAPPQEAA